MLRSDSLISGKVVVDLEVHARGEKGESLEHALDVRILALVRLEHEPARDLRIALARTRRPCGGER